MVHEQTKFVRRRWAGELTVRRAAELRLELIQALEGTDRLLIDLSGATEMDASSLQLLCSGHRTATALKKELVVSGIDSLRPVMHESGFLRHIGCAQDCRQTCIWASARG